jgi:hypothetical protein
MARVRGREARNPAAALLLLPLLQLGASHDLGPKKLRRGHKLPPPPVLQEPPERAGMPPPWGPSGNPPKTSSADWCPTASQNEARDFVYDL